MIRKEMTINDQPIESYNARLLNFSVGGSGLNHSQSSDGSLLRLPSVYHTTITPRQLSITITFFPKSFNKAKRCENSIPERLSRSTDNIVRFETDISNKVLEIGLPDGYIYKAFLQSCGTPDFDATGEQDVEYSFLAIRTKPRITRNISSGQIILCESNTSTPVRISFVISAAVAEMQVFGIGISSIGANTEIVIDSELGIITANGQNKFGDTDFTEFPYLCPGNNTIICSVPDLEITVSYTPIYA